MQVHVSLDNWPLVRLDIEEDELSQLSGLVESALKAEDRPVSNVIAGKEWIALCVTVPALLNRLRMMYNGGGGKPEEFVHNYHKWYHEWRASRWYVNVIRTCVACFFGKIVSSESLEVFPEKTSVFLIGGRDGLRDLSKALQELQSRREVVFHAIDSKNGEFEWVLNRSVES